MQERCPNCGGYFTGPHRKTVHGVWIGLAIYWVIQCGLFIVVSTYNTVSALWLWNDAMESRPIIIASFALIALVFIVGLVPPFIIDRMNTNADRAAHFRYCQRCGYRWDARQMYQPPYYPIPPIR